MMLPGKDLNLGQKFKKTKFKKYWILNFFLASNLSQDSLHFPLFRTLKNYFLCVKIFFEIPKFVLGTSPFKLIYSILKISSYVLNNNSSYIQTFFVFFLQKTSISIMMILMLFPFSSSKISSFKSVLGLFFAFFFFSFTNILTSFTCFFFEAFLFLMIFIKQFYIRILKNVKNVLIVINHFLIYTQKIFFIGSTMWPMYVIWATWIVFYKLLKKSFKYNIFSFYKFFERFL